jgi:sensor domain CHASE-containing protein
MNALSILALVSKYLPVVMGTVVAVEQNVHAPGKTKAQVALNTIQTVSQIAGEAVPEEHVQLVTGLINGVVDTLNKTGVFQKTQPKE